MRRSIADSPVDAPADSPRDTTRPSAPHSAVAAMTVTPLERCWTRRTWLSRNIVAALATTHGVHRSLRNHTRQRAPMPVTTPVQTPSARRMAAWWDDPEMVTQRAVEAAIHAGAQYADARITRTLTHGYGHDNNGVDEREHVGVGVRALFNGYWGFSAVPSGSELEVVQLARDAVAQARINARGTPRTVTMDAVPVVTGHWSTPVTIDPFTVSVEEKHAMLHYWNECAHRSGLAIDGLPGFTWLTFARQERVVATSTGSHFSQTCIESGGRISVYIQKSNDVYFRIQGIHMAARGWELFLDANIPEQMRALPARFDEEMTLEHNLIDARVGRYTLVCDGATMGAILATTVGAATQLDRALGYEANASGTSFIDDPLAMVGNLQVASPVVTVTANRSALGQLATVKWDDEGVEPQETTLIKDGILHDFQTTREQATWLAPYYQKLGRPVQSNGCAGAETAEAVTMQHMPNLALQTGGTSVSIEDLVANVKEGILMRQCDVVQVDSQARNGLVGRFEAESDMRAIKNGKLGKRLNLGSGAVQFNTIDFWKHVTTIGGASTQMVVPFSPYSYGGGRNIQRYHGREKWLPECKGEPVQATSYSAQAPAAIIENQPVIDIGRKI